MRVVFFFLGAFSLLFGAYIRDNVHETVYDDQTNLVWQDNAVVATQELNWTASIDYCENLDFAGYQDWRLPNVNELLSITDPSVYNPAIDGTFQNIAPQYHWSSTTQDSNASSAWSIGFYSGDDDADGKVGNGYVRCVREKQAATAPVAIYYLLLN